MSLMSMLLIQGGVHMVTKPHPQHIMLKGNITLNSLGFSILRLAYTLRAQILPSVIHKMFFASFNYITNL